MTNGVVYAILNYMKTSSIKQLAYRPWAGGVVAVVAQAVFAGVARAALPGIDVGSLGTDPSRGFVVNIICTVAAYMFWILIGLSVVFVLIAAYKYLTSSGDEQKVSSATKTITFAAVAIVVALLARGFPLIIVSIFPNLVGINTGVPICS